MEELLAAIGGALVGAIFSGIAFQASVNASWAKDCEQLGKTRYAGSVYECRLQQAK